MDMISRQDAIDAMTNTLWHYPNELYHNLNKYEFAKGLAELGLRSVPPAQPEPIKININHKLTSDECEKLRKEIADTPIVLLQEHNMGRWIETEGLDEEIRCLMCTNPMHTDRGCDGNCRYNERMYKKIMSALERRMMEIEHED